MGLLGVPNFLPTQEREFTFPRSTTAGVEAVQVSDLSFDGGAVFHITRTSGLVDVLEILPGTGVTRM